MEILMTLLPYGILLITGFIFIRYKLKEAEEISSQRQIEIARELFLKDFRREYLLKSVERNESIPEDKNLKLKEALKQDFLEDVSFQFHQENPSLTVEDIVSLWSELIGILVQDSESILGGAENKTAYKLWETMSTFPKDYALFCYRYFGKETNPISIKTTEDVSTTTEA